MALELARRACELTGWEESNCLATLAAAEADLGLLDEAVRRAEQALTLAAESDRTARRADLERYRALRDQKPPVG
jgi:hypothetical protein